MWIRATNIGRKCFTQGPLPVRGFEYSFLGFPQQSIHQMVHIDAWQIVLRNRHSSSSSRKACRQLRLNRTCTGTDASVGNCMVIWGCEVTGCEKSASLIVSEKHSVIYLEVSKIYVRLVTKLHASTKYATPTFHERFVRRRINEGTL